MAGAYKYRPQYTQNTIGPDAGTPVRPSGNLESGEGMSEFWKELDEQPLAGIVLTAFALFGFFALIHWAVTP